MNCRRLLATMSIATAALSAKSVAAQAANPFVGTWSVEYEVGRRMEDGEVTSITGKGILKIEASGDSLIISLQGPPRPDGTAVPAATLGGRVANGTAVINQKSEARMNMNGEVTAVVVNITWTLQANGDTLTGTLRRELPAGMPAHDEPTPVKGTRSKA